MAMRVSSVMCSSRGGASVVIARLLVAVVLVVTGGARQEYHAGLRETVLDLRLVVLVGVGRLLASGVLPLHHPGLDRPGDGVDVAVLDGRRPVQGPRSILVREQDEPSRVTGEGTVLDAIEHLVVGSGRVVGVEGDQVVKRGSRVELRVVYHHA